MITISNSIRSTFPFFVFVPHLFNICLVNTFYTVNTALNMQLSTCNRSSSQNCDSNKRKFNFTRQYNYCFQHNQLVSFLFSKWSNFSIKVHPHTTNRCCIVVLCTLYQIIKRTHSLFTS